MGFGPCSLFCLLGTSITGMLACKTTGSSTIHNNRLNVAILSPLKPLPVLRCPAAEPTYNPVSQISLVAGSYQIEISVLCQ